MRGSYHFRVKSKKTLFEFAIKRNITIIKGDSATGKTTLLHMLYEYLRVGKESGYFVSADVDYFVYMRKEVGRDWKEALLPLKNTVIFIEENNDFVFGEEFAEFVKVSGNYFVLVNRAPLKMLPYSIHEIYEIVTEGKRADVRESYHKLKELYSNYPIAENNRIQNVVTEDSNSGYQFFKKVFADSKVLSANGNGNIINKIKEQEGKDTLVIADGAAFGAMIENCLEYFKTKSRNRISIWLPESFEFLILKSGIIQSEKLTAILEAPFDYIECQDYESWERFFTELLISLTNDTPYKYMKSSLNTSYLQERSIQRILEQMPEEIKANVNRGENTMYDVTAIGELLIDFASKETDADGYPTMKANPGGAPGNFLAALNAYGAKTAFLGKVGDDAFGKLLLKTFENAGIETKGILMDDSVFTTLAFVTFSPGGDRSFSFARKPGADTRLSFEEIDLSMIDESRIFHFGTLSLTDEPVRTATQKTVAYAKKEGKLITFDPNLRLPLWPDAKAAKNQMLWGLSQADVVKISDEEVKFLWGITDEKEAAEKLISEYGVKLAMVTMGPKGAYLANANASAMAKCPAVKPIDTTGAGDIFGGSAVSRILKTGKAPELLNEEELSMIGNFACTAASLSTTRSGGIPSIPKEEEVWATIVT